MGLMRNLGWSLGTKEVDMIEIRFKDGEQASWPVMRALMRLVAALDQPATEVVRVTATKVEVRRPGGGIFDERPGSLGFSGQPSEMALLIEVARHAVWLQHGEKAIARLCTPENEKRLRAQPHADSPNRFRYMMHSGRAALAYTLGFTEIEEILYQDTWMFRSTADCYALLEMMVWELQAGRDPRTVYEAFKTPDLAA